MTIILPQDLPAAAILRREGIDVIDAEDLAGHGEASLRIAVLNLMPCKATTEAQLARRLGDTGPYRGPHILYSGQSPTEIDGKQPY